MIFISLLQEWVNSFGKPFYLHEQSYAALAQMNKDDWNLRMQGQLFETGIRLKVTGYDVLRDYITSQLGDTMPQEGHNG